MSTNKSKLASFKANRASHLSSSPLPSLRPEIKLSLIKINSSTLSQDTSARISQLLPPIPKFKPPLERLQKSLKKSLLSSQSPTYSPYFTPQKELAFKNVKIQLDSKRLDEIQKKRDIVRSKRELINHFEPSLPPKLYQIVLHMSLLLKSLNEESITEKENYEESHILFLDKSVEIEAMFFKIYEEFLTEYKEGTLKVLGSKKTILELMQKVDKLQSENDGLEKKIMKGKLKATPGEKDVGFLMFENSKLEMEVEKLKERLKQFEIYDVGHIIKELEVVKMASEEKIRVVQYELNLLKGKDDNHQNLINFYKNSINKLEKEVKHWIQASGENQKIIDRLTEKNEQFQLSCSQYRELYLMENEELLMFRQKKQETSLFVHDLQEKIRVLNIKIDKLTIQKGDNVDETSYKNDLTIISTLAEIYTEHKFRRLTKDNPISNRLMSDATMKAPKLTNTRTYESAVTHPVFLRKFNFLKAPFFKLIEHRFKTTNYSVKNNKKPNFHELLSKIRGIFDSKFNEFLLFSDPKLFSNFPDFIYSWLGKYEINYTNHKINKIDIFSSNINIDDLRIQFLLDLTDPKVEKLWECSTFCDFFEEKLSLDELYFYLYCRNLLFQGPQLQSLSAFFDLIHYIPFERAEMVIDLIMQKYDITLKSTIKSKLSEKSKRKGRKIFIDSAFTLRILLEYYRLERVDKFYLLEELFSSKLHKEDEKETVNFENFKKIIQFNWPQITDLETAELFRESWGIGQGSVNSESFFAVANENKFFIKTLKLPSLMIFDENMDKFIKNPYDTVRSVFFEQFSLIKQRIEILEGVISGLGLEILEERFRRMMKSIYSDFQMPTEEMREKYISHFMNEFLYLVHSVLKILNSGEIMQDPLKEVEFLSKKEQFKSLSEKIREIWKEDILREIRENTIAKKIQKMVKGKKNQKNLLGQVVMKNINKNNKF